MSEFKGIPGPWVSRQTYSKGEPDAWAVTAGTYFICECIDGVTDGECEANARLIAAAPDLLEALTALAHYVQALPVEATNYREERCRVVLANACGAIEKATKGEA